MIGFRFVFLQLYVTVVISISGFPKMITAEYAPEVDANFDQPSESIIVTWTEPNKTRETLRAYSVRLVHKRWRHSCSVRVPQIAFNVSSKVHKVVFNPTQFKFSSSYEVYVAVITDEKGPERSKAFITPESIPEAAPKRFSVSNVTSTTCYLNWRTPDCAYWNGRITYQIWGKGLKTVGNLTQTYIHYTELAPNTSYEVTVAACTSAGCGQNTIKTTFTTLTLKPDPPRDLTVFSWSINSLSITWLPPISSTSNITKYKIQHAKKNGEETSSIFYVIEDVQRLACKNSKLRRDRLCYTINKLGSRSDYDIWVIAFDDKGEKSNREEAHVTGRTEESNHKAPSKLELENRTTTSLFVSWLEPVRIIGELIGYRINVTLINLYGLSSIDSRVVYSFVEDNWNVTIRNITGLEPASTYNVTVEAATKLGYGPPIHQLFYTRNLVPQDTVRLETGKITKDTVQLLIKLIDNYNGPISAYLVLVKDVTQKRDKRQTLELGAYNQSNIEYIAAKLNASELRAPGGTNFTVGDGKYYEEFYNAPLKNEHEYIFGTAVISEVDGEKQIVFAYLYEVVYVTEKLPGLAPSVTSPEMRFFNSTIILTVILVFGVFFFILYYKKPELFCRVVKKTRTIRETGPVKERVCSINSEIDTNLYEDFKPKSVEEVYLYDECSTDSVAENLTKRETSFYDDCLDIKNRIAPKQIDVKDLKAYVQKVKTSSIDVSQEYKTIINGVFHPCKVGKQSENKSKNRFLALVPYDHCRVKLKQIEGYNYSDYINASYIQNYKGDPKYIATQGPISLTVVDFWRMVWQENTCKIIMLTNLVEGGKIKCEKYWPENEDKYGPFTVKLEDAKTFANYVIRTIAITKNGFEREIKQFHFTTWPDHGIPLYTVSVTTFLKQITSYREDSESPIVVHGSAGSGRTGTFILLSNMIEMAKDTNKVDLLHGLWSIRQCRVNMVETLEQYIFVYHALLDYLGDDTYTELI